MDTRGGKVGTYHFTVWARDRSSAGTYGNNYGRWDQSASFPYVLTKASGVTPCTGVNDSAAPAEPPIQLVGTTVTVTASAVGCPHPLYEFWLLAPGAASYRDVKAYSSSWVLTLDTTNYAPGKYRFSVWVRDASSAGTSGNSSGRWDAFNANLTYTLNPGCTSVSDTAVPANTAAVGTTITITATSTGCPTRPVYEFWIQAPGAGAYTMAQSYANGSPKYTWNTTGLVPGSYRFSVWVLDANSPGAHGNNSGRWDAFNANLVYAVTGCPSVTDSASPPTTARVGTTVTITATPGACPSPQYEFWYLQPGSSVYTPGRSPQVYGTSPWAWNTTGLPKGSYRIAVWIKDAKSGGVSGNSSGRWDAYNSNLLYTLT